MERRKLRRDSWDDVVKMEELLPLLEVTGCVTVGMGRSDTVEVWLSLALVEGMCWMTD